MTAILRGETSERSGGVSLNGPTYRRRFMVRTTSVLDGPHTVVRCDGLPQMLTSYQDGNGNVDPTAFVIDLQAVARESPSEWFVDVDYGPVDAEIISGTADNPLARPIEFSGGLAQHTRLITRALNLETQEYETIQNSAGDPYAAQEIDDSRPELEVTRNVAGFSLLLPALFKDSVNADTFLGVFPPGTLKCNYIGFRRQQQGGLVYTEVTAHIHYAETWDIELLDEGFFKRVAGVRERIEIPGVGGRLIFPTEPQLLNGQGDVLDPTQEDPKYRTYRTYNWRRFSDLLL